MSVIILERVLAFISVIKQTKQSSTVVCASNLDTQMVEAGRITSLSYTVSSCQIYDRDYLRRGEGGGGGWGEKKEGNAAPVPERAFLFYTAGQAVG